MNTITQITNTLWMRQKPVPEMGCVYFCAPVVIQNTNTVFWECGSFGILHNDKV